jgi:hypothetical protein
METDAEPDVEEDTSTPASTKWPWEAVRNKLVEALTEMTVLSDVISISTKECGKDPQVKRRCEPKLGFTDFKILLSLSLTSTFSI